GRADGSVLRRGLRPREAGRLVNNTTSPRAANQQVVAMGHANEAAILEVDAGGVQSAPWSASSDNDWRGRGRRCAPSETSAGAWLASGAGWPAPSADRSLAE